MTYIVGVIDVLLVVSFVCFLVRAIAKFGKSLHTFIYKFLYGEPINTERRYISSSRWEKYEIK